MFLVRSPQHTLMRARMAWSSQHATAVRSPSQWRCARAVHLLCCAAILDDGRCPRGYTVGIDLGTTNSAIAILQDGAPVMVPNARGDYTTPSAVTYCANGGVLVGRDALDSSDLSNTVQSAKRFIGRAMQTLVADVEMAGVRVRAGENGEALFACPALEEPVSAEEVSAQVLRALLADAERMTGSRAQRAVITVPAYFDDRQRRATRVAATLAGLEEVHLIAEPVAACLAHQLSGATGTVLVFDLGAGTFDVSVLRLDEKGGVEVVATSGDPRLGGNDFDAALAGWLDAESRDSADEASDAHGDRQRILLRAAEDAKKRLSVLKTVDVALPGGANHGDDAQAADDAAGRAIALGRATLESLCEPLFQRLRAPLYEVALSARLTIPGELDPNYGKAAKRPKAKKRRALAQQRPEGRQKYLPTGSPVDEIVLVGGGTHMVGVRKLVSNLFGVDPRRTVDPMQAVALGAAVHAGVLSGEIQGVRVMQAWQAQLGRLLERGGADTALGVVPTVLTEERSAAEIAAEEEEEEQAMQAAMRQQQAHEP